MDWYYSKRGAQQGPVGLGELQRLLADGDIAAGDLVWHEGMADWTAAGEVAELRAAGADELGGGPAAAMPVESASPFSVASPALGSQRLKGMAIGSMICGIVGLLTCLGIPLGLVAVVLGHIARSNARKNPGVFGGEGMALAGLLTGYLSILLSLVIIVALMSVKPEEWRAEIMRQQQEQRKQMEQPEAEDLAPPTR
jgi:hypothetical protein